jgi:hypothetical protein
MKSLVFNLLHQGATEAGCATEAWEIVAEFAATEALLERAGGKPTFNDVALPPVVVLAAEALLQCLGGDDDVADEPVRPSVAPSEN